VYSLPFDAPFSRFLSSPSDSSIISLTDSITHFSVLSSDADNFSFACSKDFFPITFTLVSVSCSINLYLWRDPAEWPSKDSSDWSVMGANSNPFVLQADDPYFKSASMQGLYQLSISSESKNCAYALTVTNRLLPIAFLSPGLSLQNNGKSISDLYFAYYNNYSESVVLSLTVSLGDAFLLVSTIPDLDSDLSKFFPTVNNSTWNSNLSPDKYLVLVSQNNSLFCSSCFYIIKVISTPGSKFSLLAKSEQSVEVLENGQPVKSKLSSSGSEVFGFPFLTSPFYVTLYVLSGSASLHICNCNSPEVLLWTSPNNSALQTISVQTLDKQFEAYNFCAFVIRKDSAIYSILWHTETAPIRLIDGWPQGYEMSFVNHTKASFTFSAQSSVFCALDSLDRWFYPSVQAKSLASGFFRTYTSMDYAGKHLAMTFSMSESDTLLLDITAAKSANILSGQFSLFCTKSFHPAFLPLNRLSLAVMEPGALPMRYELNIRSKTDLKVFVVPCEGDVKLEVSSKSTVISEKTPDLAISRLADGVMYGIVTGALGNYYLTVNNTDREERAAFQIYADGEAKQRICPGNNGIVTVEKFKNGVNINWNPVHYENGTVYEGKVKYKLYQASRSMGKVTTSCEMLYGSTQDRVRLVGETSTTHFYLHFKKDLESGAANILAEVEEDNEVALSDVAYSEFEILVEEGNEDKNGIIFMLVGVVFVLMVLTFVGFWVYRKVKVRNEEVQEKIKDGTVVDEIPMSVLEKFGKEGNTPRDDED
jgi:hypothetical protein